jgi:hypothetical protein
MLGVLKFVATFFAKSKSLSFSSKIVSLEASILSLVAPTANIETINATKKSTLIGLESIKFL